MNESKISVPSVSSMKEQVLEMVQLAIEEFKTKIDIEVNVPMISYDLKGTTAGMHEYSSYSENSHVLKFNLQIMKDNWEHFCFQTVVHETAHYLAYKWKGEERTRTGRRRCHGATWMAIMAFLGADVKRCHNYNVDNVRKTRRSFSYSCTCGEPHNLSIVRHNRAMKGVGYHCTKCKSSLNFVEENR